MRDSRYIAIIPKQKEGQENPVSMDFENENDSCGFKIHLVYWEDIKENDILKGYVETTLKYNEDNETKKSQILNNLLQRRKR